jgi:hypothetical protein
MEPKNLPRAELLWASPREVLNVVQAQVDFNDAVNVRKIAKQVQVAKADRADQALGLCSEHRTPRGKFKAHKW